MSSFLRVLTRRDAIKTGAAAAGAVALGSWSRAANAAPPKIRYATGGGIGPNEMETIIFLDYMKQNVLKNYGKAYTLEMTFTRGTPEAASLLAAGQADLATLSCSAFATIVVKNAVPGGLSIISDNYQDGHTGNASNTFFVLKDSPITKVTDLKGKKVGINAFGSAVDLVLRVVLKKNGLDPRRDVEIVEIAFPNMASAIREKRIDCGCLVIPFLAAEAPKGDLRALFTGGDAFGPSSVIFQVTTNSFLKSNEAAVRAFLADYVQGLAWYYDPANRSKAIELVADFTKSPKPVLESYFATARDYYRDRNGCVAAVSIQKPIDAMVEEKLLAQKVDASKYLNLSLLPKSCPI
ncbi:MAG TPA: ABC transporter substrate-binding protein [Xanthobacteraceae bacterium]|jgi:NitT/TauT family transport system substrate-binding protein|nr:ABC transporter substrate-binding protein [Xanthobacteraceae bacterium]